MRADALPYDIDGIRYSVCRPAEVDELVALLARTFSRHDPPAIALGLTAEDFTTYLAAITASRASVGLTIVARDVVSGELAGGIATEDVAAPAQFDLEALSPKFGPMFELVEQLDESIGPANPIQPGSVLHVFMLGVDEPFARRGIAQRLVVACLANGAALGYQIAVTEATNLVSQHIFTKLGFTTRAQTSYGGYHRDGVAIFDSIAEHGGIMSMIRSIRLPPGLAIHAAYRETSDIPEPDIDRMLDEIELGYLGGEPEA